MSWPGHGDGRLGHGDLGIDVVDLRTLVGFLVLAARRARPILTALPGGFDENKASVVVHKQLQAVQNRWNVRIMEFHSEGILNPPDGQPTKIRGRIDFLVKFRKHFGYANAYFGVEAKCISLGRPDQMSYYLNSGVKKFANGTYSLGHPEAILLGYLVAPPRAGVPAAIDRRLVRRHGRAATLSPWGPRYRDADVVEGMIPRRGSPSIRLLHAVVRMHP